MPGKRNSHENIELITTTLGAWLTVLISKWPNTTPSLWILTVNYGSEWRKYVRKDVPGVDKYGAEAFKNMKYDENGIATIMLPVIYHAFGKACEQSDKDKIVIKELIGCIPLTSLDFLYCGNKYYIPLSCNIDIEETPTENELIEIIIRVFSPKVFHYSQKTIPYPYCIVESIDLLR